MLFLEVNSFQPIILRRHFFYCSEEQETPYNSEAKSPFALDLISLLEIQLIVNPNYNPKIRCQQLVDGVPGCI